MEKEIQYHEQDDILVFDDSLRHSAFNESASESRIVLIIDLLRPEGISPGVAQGMITSQLQDFMDLFK